MLAESSDAENLHIVPHDFPSGTQLGVALLSTETWDAYRAATQGWSQFLVRNAQIMLCKCQVAVGEVGAKFVECLHILNEVAMGVRQTSAREIWKSEISLSKGKAESGCIILSLNDDALPVAIAASTAPTCKILGVANTLFPNPVSYPVGLAGDTEIPYT